MKEEDFLKWNEVMFEKYTNERLYFHPNFVIRYIENKRVKLIVNAVKGETKNKVLEIGCGEAYILRKLKNKNIIGLDISDIALKYAKDKLKNNSSVQLIRGDAQIIPLKNNSIDKIVCSEVLEHVINPKKVIEEIVRISKVDSTIVVTIPNEVLINRVKNLFLKLRLYKLLLAEIPERMDCEWHLHSFSLKLLKSMIEGKLNISKIKASPFRFLPIRYIVICKKQNNETY